MKKNDIDTENLISFGEDPKAENDKALREQGSKLQSAPTKAQNEVSGLYQSFDSIPILSRQIVDREIVTSYLWANKTKKGAGIRIRISGRGSCADCEIHDLNIIDELIERIQHLRTSIVDAKRLEVAK